MCDRSGTDHISEGRPSTIQFEATASNGLEVVYSLETGVTQLLPQGLRLTTDGYLIGRPSFRHFAVDSDKTIVYVADNTGIAVGMSVTGPGVGTGAEVIDLPDTNRIIVDEEYKWKSDCVLVGTFFGGPEKHVRQVSDLTLNFLENEMLNQNMINNEQIALAYIQKRYPELFDIYIETYGGHLPVLKIL